MGKALAEGEDCGFLVFFVFGETFGASHETSEKSNSTRPFGFSFRAASNFLLVLLDLNPFNTLVLPLVNNCLTIVLLMFLPDML